MTEGRLENMQSSVIPAANKERQLPATRRPRACLVEMTPLARCLMDILGSGQSGVDSVDGIPGTIHKTSDLLVATEERGFLPRLRYWQEVARDLDLTLLCIHVQDSELILGPFIAPSTPGCIECWSMRYYKGRNNARRFAETPARAAIHGAPLLTPLVIGLAGAIIADWIVQYFANTQETIGQTYNLNLESLTGERERFLPHPLCSQCAPVVWDSAEGSRVSLRPRITPHDSAARLQVDVCSLLPALQSNYVSTHTGIIRDLNMSFPIQHVATATAGICLGPSPRLEPCSGFSSSYKEAQAVAMLEALERYSSYCQRARRPAVYGSVSSLHPAAIDPYPFGLPSEEEYKHTDVLTRYTEQLNMDFVWAHSFAKDHPVLVPAQLAFYASTRPGEPRFVIEGSNGCSLGSTPEEALLHGLLEVIERDSALMTWYGRLERPTFDPMTSSDPEVRARCRRLQWEGYQVVAFDTTTDFTVPAVLLVARRRRENNRLPYFLAVGAAHYHPEKALRKAFRELTACFSRYAQELRRDFGWRRAHILSEDPRRVRTIEDHALLYCLRQSHEATAFLSGGTTHTSLADLTELGRPFCSRDLTETLRRIIDRVLGAGGDVIAVNQTSPELARIDMACCKALVSGAVPMTFGNVSRRLDGIGRLDALLRQKRLAINPVPHPFC